MALFSIQFAGAVGISNCPGAPALNAFIGMLMPILITLLGTHYMNNRPQGCHSGRS